VFNGTGANVLSLHGDDAPLGCGGVQRERAHPHRRERRAGAGRRAQAADRAHPRRASSPPKLIDRQAWGWGDEHGRSRWVVSITQTTELGTAYTPQEIRAIAEHIHPLGMRLHLDGSRIANAAASLDAPLRAFTTDTGVDVLSFGGTKNGLLFGEAVVVLRSEAAVRAALPAGR